MIVVTGGAGFIGSNLVHALNREGEDDILVVDSLERGIKYRNLVGSRFADIVDKAEFRAMVDRADGALDRARAVVHLGACSSTTEWNGRYLLENNYAYSKAVFGLCQRRSIPMVYASSAAVYGSSPECSDEDPSGETPLNVYGFSKQIFDAWVRRRAASLRAPVIGLRFFNVYGPREAHKGKMASVVFHFARQVRNGGVVQLFGEGEGCGPGEHRRDFVHVDDVVAATLHLLRGGAESGIYNVGTGRARSFLDVARAVIGYLGAGEIRFIEFPAELRGKYQSNTRARIGRLVKAGFVRPMADVEEGVAKTLRWGAENAWLNEGEA